MNEKPGQRQAPFPNIFLIGVQKAGTTTLNDWLSQHPQIYCYNSLKDFTIISEKKIEVKTMNGHAADAFQILGVK